MATPGTGTVDEAARGTIAERAGGGIPADPATAAAELVAGLARRPWGVVSPSVYETARLVATPGWTGTGQGRDSSETGTQEHAGPGYDVARVRYLLDQQHPDGTWGGPGGYAVVPTLSATEALLAVVDREPTGRYAPLDPARIRRAAARGMSACQEVLRLPRTALPDTVAIELLVPALTGALADRLARPGAATGPHGLPGAPATESPDDDRLGPWRDRLGAPRPPLRPGTPVPQKLAHTLELLTLHGLTDACADVRPAPGGGVGASPAATASWLWAQHTAGRRTAAQRAAAAYLASAQAPHGGPVPSVVPITAWERAWVLTGLHQAGLRVPVPATLLDELAASVGPDGAAGAPGLPTDADTTSVVLLALALHGRPTDPDCLWRFRVGRHFCVWPGERTASPSTNAHVLELFGHHAGTGHRAGFDRPPAGSVAGRSADDGSPADRYVEAMAGIADWLLDAQLPDGYWTDKWHASPYYATGCVALALHRYGGPTARPAVHRALRWLAATQREDGSWGRFGGTVEETGYALRLLMATHPGAPAVDRAYGYLRSAFGRLPDPPLWHDKDLYLPATVVRADALGVLALARSTR